VKLPNYGINYYNSSDLNDQNMIFGIGLAERESNPITYRITVYKANSNLEEYFLKENAKVENIKIDNVDAKRFIYENIFTGEDGFERPITSVSTLITHDGKIYETWLLDKRKNEDPTGPYYNNYDFYEQILSTFKFIK